MFDPISLLVGAALLGAGWAAGRVTRTSPGPKAPVAVCGCGHALALHDGQSGECFGEIQRPHYWGDGTRNGNEWVGCGCRQYVGPRPIEDLLAQTYLPPSDD